MRLRKGSAVQTLGGALGTVTQVTKSKVRVLLPIRKFQWMLKADVRIVGFDGNGSKIHWR